MMDTEAVMNFIKGLVKETMKNSNVEVLISEDMPLIGSENSLDSMGLIELCLALEDKALESGFEFDWTSDMAMSRSRSMFRSIKSLAKEYTHQYDSKK